MVGLFHSCITNSIRLSPVARNSSSHSLAFSILYEASTMNCEVQNQPPVSNTPFYPGYGSQLLLPINI